MKNKMTEMARRAKLMPIGAVLLSLAFAGAADAQRRPQRDYNNDRDTRYPSGAANRAGLPQGTVLPVRLDEPLSSKEATQGERFTATVIEGADDVGLPKGTRVEGTIREAVPSSDGRAGSLDVNFRRLLLPDGSAQPITGSLYSLSGKAINRSDGRLVATADKGRDRLKFIGIGAGAGLLIGTLTKQNSIFSLLLGAGAGYLYNEAGNKPKPGDVNLKAGQEFGVRLDRQLAYNTRTRDYFRRSTVSTVSDDPDRRTDSNYGNDVRIALDGRTMRFTDANRPYIRNGAVFVPLAAMGQALGFDYRYDASTKTIYAHGDEVQTTLGRRNATIDGNRRRMPAAAEQRRGVTFVPLQFIGWAEHDASVDWDEASGTATITSRERP